MESEKQKIIEEKANKENTILEKNKQIVSLNKIIAENEEKKKEKISLIFELDKLLSNNKDAKKPQFIIEDKRDKKFIQIVNTLFAHYPLLKHINIKSFENKNDSSKINYYSTPNDNNLNDDSIVSIKLE